MEKMFDVVILGGGIMGMSTAFELSKNEGLKIAVFEQDTVGNAGATSVSGGIIRAFDFNINHALMTLLSIDQHRKNKKSMDFVTDGHFYMIPKNDFNRALDVLKLFLKYRYPFHVLSHEEALKLAPDLIFDKDELIIWEPTSGYANPSKMAHFLKDSYVQNGGSLFESTKVEMLKKTKDGLTEIVVKGEVFHAKKIVISMGAGNRQFLEKHNYVTQNKRIEIIKGSLGNSPKIAFNDFHSGLYSRPIEGNGRIIGIPQPVFNIDPYTSEKTFNESLFKDNAKISGRVNGYKYKDEFEKISSADSYTESELPTIRFIQKNWLLIDGLNGAGFKMYPALTNYVLINILKK